MSSSRLARTGAGVSATAGAKRHLLLAALAVAATMGLAGATEAERANLGDKAAVQLQIHWLWAVTEVQNLLGIYTYWHTSGFNHRVPELYTKTDDTVIEMMWGRNLECQHGARHVWLDEISSSP